MIQLLLIFGLALSANAQASAACDDGWVSVGQKCLLLVTGDGALAFDDATAACTALGATLATIESADENEAIGQMIQPKTGDKWGSNKGLTYIGLQYPYSTFDDGTPVTVTPWAAREPNGQGEKCAVYGSYHQWQDVKCKRAFNYLCQKKVASVTSAAIVASPSPVIVAPPNPVLVAPPPVNPCEGKEDIRTPKSDCEWYADKNWCTTQYVDWMALNCALTCCEKAQETQIGEVNRLTRVNNALRIALEALEN